MEGGLKVHLIGDWGTQCDSAGLDNREKVDYDNGMTSFFDGTPDDDADDDGLGGCKLVSITFHIIFHRKRCISGGLELRSERRNCGVDGAWDLDRSRD